MKRFEKAWSEKFEVKHSVSVNSNTSGLYAAMGAIGVSPEDEVIVSPFTMSALPLLRLDMARSQALQILRMILSA